MALPKIGITSQSEQGHFLEYTGLRIALQPLQRPWPQGGVRQETGNMVHYKLHLGQSVSHRVPLGWALILMVGPMTVRLITYTRPLTPSQQGLALA